MTIKIPSFAQWLTHNFRELFPVRQFAIDQGRFWTSDTGWFQVSQRNRYIYVTFLCPGFQLANVPMLSRIIEEEYINFCKKYWPGASADFDFTYSAEYAPYIAAVRTPDSE